MQLRAGVCLENGTIVVLAVGHKEGMPAEFGGILLHYTVQRSPGQKTKLTLQKTQFYFPSILPRLLDQVRAVGNEKIVVVQDTPDDSDRFEAYAIDLTSKR